MKYKVCHPAACICILHFQTHNVSIIMHLARIASAINTADIDYEDDNGIVGESEGADEN